MISSILCPDNFDLFSIQDLSEFCNGSTCAKAVSIGTFEFKLMETRLTVKVSTINNKVEFNLYSFNIHCR